MGGGRQDCGYDEPGHILGSAACLQHINYNHIYSDGTATDRRWDHGRHVHREVQAAANASCCVIREESFVRLTTAPEIQRAKK